MIMIIRRHPRWFVLAVAASMAVVYLVLICLPRRAALANQQSSLSLMQAFIQQAAGVPMRVIIIQQDMENAQGYCRQWRTRLPQASEVSQRQDEIFRAAEAAGTQVIRFDPQSPVPLRQLSQLPVNVTCEGSFNNLFDFISRIEALPNPIWVDQLTMAPEGASSARLRCELSLTVFTENTNDSGYAKHADRPIRKR